MAWFDSSTYTELNTISELIVVTYTGNRCLAVKLTVFVLNPAITCDQYPKSSVIIRVLHV